MPYTDETDGAIVGLVCLAMLVVGSAAWGWAGLFVGLVVLLLVRSINGVR